MPRPKVPLQNRKRAVHACLHCRSSKKRCDGKRPCAGCVRKGVGSSCVFDEDPASPSNGYPALNGQNLGLSSPTSANACRVVELVAPNTVISPATTIGTSVFSPEASHRTHPRLLDNSTGEKVFIGGSASLAFLQLLRDTVSQILGSSDFSHHAERDHMLEEPQTQAQPISAVRLDSEQEQSFLNAFNIASQGLVQILSKESLLSILDKSRSQSSQLKPFQLAIAQTALAIGAQCSSRNDENLMISRSYFAEAQKQGFEGMIANPSLEMVQLFLLLSFYMLGACHRNAAFMYVGVAARAAYVLGLHYVHFEESSSTEGNTQKRITWSCLVTLDTMISSILGRPSATSTQSSRSQDSIPVSDTTVDSKYAAMQANFELACLLDQKVQELYSSDRVTTEGAKACLDQLSAWSTRLPSSLRLASTDLNGPDTQRQVIGALHVSCFYYFAVMLVSRPFLIVSLTNKLAKNQTGSEGLTVGSEEANQEAQIQDIASACLNAAIYMIQTCVETRSHGLLPDNMRILKAWVFAAGLVLGFEMFTTHQSSFEIEEAFKGSCSISKTLSTHSAQAAHNYGILTSLSQAIIARRRQALSERRHTDKPVVERIMAFQSTADPNRNDNATYRDVSSLELATSMEHDRTTNDGWFPGLASDFDYQEMVNEPFLNWDNADFLAWDPFSRDLPV